jgi:hypothetical protein
LGTLEVGTLGAATATPQPGVEQAMGSISAMHLSLLGLDIKADELTSAAQSTMGAGCSAVNSVGRSHVGRFTVNGKAIEIGSAPFVLKLPLGLGAIYLNQQVTTATSIVQRALFVDLPGTFLDVVLGQASTGASCDAPVKIASAIKHGPKPTKAQIKSVKARLQKLGNRSF